METFMPSRFYWSSMLLIAASAVFAGDVRHPGDPHYTPSGFFDIHVCNWPDRKPFYMVLYSTGKYDDIETVHIIGANGKPLAELDPDIFRLSENEPDMRILTSHVPISNEYEDGWFVAEINMKDGSSHRASDLVIHRLMPYVTGHEPVDGAQDIPLPEVLKWDDTFGAYWYRVFIRDNWDDQKLIYSSRLLPYPEIELPAGLLNPGGYYSWKVQARDEKGDLNLGDFNTGSQSDWVTFSVQED